MPDDRARSEATPGDEPPATAAPTGPDHPRPDQTRPGEVGAPDPREAEPASVEETRGDARVSAAPGDPDDAVGSDHPDDAVESSDPAGAVDAETERSQPVQAPPEHHEVMAEDRPEEDLTDPPVTVESASASTDAEADSDPEVYVDAEVQVESGTGNIGTEVAPEESDAAEPVAPEAVTGESADDGPAADTAAEAPSIWSREHRTAGTGSTPAEPDPASSAEPGTEDPEPSPVDAAPARPTVRDWLRPERTQVVVALVLAVVAFGAVTQIRTRGQVDSYSSLRQSDLVGMLDGLNQESQRLQSELESLQSARNELESGQNNEALARSQAEDRLTALGILAGTLPAQGPGITITITDPQGKVKPAMILDALEEMRDAGGEVIQINGRIRVVASSWVGSGPAGIVVDGQAVSTPITMEVIGDPHSLEEAARFRGGLVSQMTDPRVGGQVSIARSDRLSITSLHTVQSPRFARTVESTGGSTPAGN